MLLAAQTFSAGPPTWAPGIVAVGLIVVVIILSPGLSRTIKERMENLSQFFYPVRDQDADGEDDESAPKLPPNRSRAEDPEIKKFDRSLFDAFLKPEQSNTDDPNQKQ